MFGTRSVATGPKDGEKEIGIRTEGELRMEDSPGKRTVLLASGALTIFVGLIAGVMVWLFSVDAGALPLIVGGTIVLVGVVLAGLAFVFKKGTAPPPASQHTSGSKVVTYAAPSHYLEGYELDCVRQHRFVKFREFWQPLFPGVIMLLLGLLAGGLLWFFGVEPWLTLTVFGLSVVAAIVLLLPFGPKWLYLPTEKNIPGKALASLQEFRKGEQARKAFWTELHTAIAQMKWLAKRPGMKLILLIANHKGTAGKSTLGLNVLSLITWHCHLQLAFYPTTVNTINANHGEMTRVDPETAMRVGNLTERVETGEFKTTEELIRAIPTTDEGLAIIFEDKSRGVGEKKNVTLDQFRRNQKALLPAYVGEGLDTGNDDIDEETIVLEAAHLATAILASGNHTLDVTVDRMGTTLNRYYTDPFRVAETTRNGTLTNGITPNQPVPGDGSHCSTRYKIEQATLVVNRVPDGEVVDFSKLTANVNHRGDTFVTGVDSYINQKPTPPSDIHAIDEATYLAYCKIAVSVFVQAANVLGLDISGLDQVKPTGRLYHPQLQPVDLAGRFIGIDTTPTDIMAPELTASPAPAKNPSQEPHAPKDASVPDESTATPTSTEQSGEVKQNGSPVISPDMQAFMPTLTLTGAGHQSPEGGSKQ